MLLFRSTEQLRDFEGVSIVPMPDSVEIREVDCPKITGYINLHLKDGTYYLMRTEGRFTYLEPENRFVLTDPGLGLDVKDQMVYYEATDQQYYRFEIETRNLQKRLRSIFFALGGKITHTWTEKIRFERLKFHEGRFIYRFGSNIIERVDDEWIPLPEMSLKQFLKLPEIVPMNEELEKLIGVRFNRYRMLPPGEWFYQVKRRLKLHLTEKFGGLLVPRSGLPLERSADLKRWFPAGDLAASYAGSFEGRITEPWMPVPICDTQPSFFYSPAHQKYFFYNRANITTDCRYIQLSTSSDARSWSENQTIFTPDFDYSSGHNYYTPAMFLYRDQKTILSLNCYVTSPTLTSLHADDRVLISTDGLHFDKLCSWREKEYHETKMTDALHFIHDVLLAIPQTMRYSDDRIEWFAFEIGPKGKIFKLSTRLDGFTAVSGSGRFTTHRLRFESEIRLNFRGSLRIEFLDADETVVGSQTVEGDSTATALSVPADSAYLRFEIDGQLFSVDGVEELSSDQIDDAEPKRSIRFYYRRMYDRLGSRDLFKSQKSGWREVTPDLPSTHSIAELVGRPICELGSAVIKQRIRLTDGSEQTVTLVDTTVDPEDSLAATGLFTEFFLTEGAPGAVYDVRLV